MLQDCKMLQYTVKKAHIASAGMKWGMGNDNCLYLCDLGISVKLNFHIEVFSGLKKRKHDCHKKV